VAAARESCPRSSIHIHRRRGSLLILSSFCAFLLVVAGRDVEVVSLTQMVGPQFEEEACKEMKRILPRVCPWADRIWGLERRDDLVLSSTGAAREADILGYMKERNPSPCVATDGVNIFLPAEEALVLPAEPRIPLGGRRFSPTQDARGAQKYFIAEAYSGSHYETILEKLAQLDTLLSFISSRFAERQGLMVAPDLTSVVGACALVLSCGEGRRGDFLDGLVRRLRSEVDPPGPNVWRMMRAGRFFIVALSARQTPSAHAIRITGRVLAGRARLVAHQKEEAVELE
jgi:hypothetical protein